MSSAIIQLLVALFSLLGHAALKATHVTLDFAEKGVRRWRQSQQEKH